MNYKNQKEKKHQERNINQDNTNSSTPVFQKYTDNRPEMQSAAQLYAAIRANTIANRPSYISVPNPPTQRQVHPLFQNRNSSPVQRKEVENGDFHIQMARDEMSKSPVTERFIVPSVSDDEDKAIQQKENNTGLPNNLKSGIENLSGYSMDDVKVHYNSDKPAQLQAHAYAQGTDIHVASGQEKHLPHEAWHVVQQKQGRVKPTIQMKGDVNVNDDAGLEREADVMGAKANNIIQAKQKEDKPPKYKSSNFQNSNSIQLQLETIGTKDAEKCYYTDIDATTMDKEAFQGIKGAALAKLDDQKWTFRGKSSQFVFTQMLEKRHGDLTTQQVEDICINKKNLSEKHLEYIATSETAFQGITITYFRKYPKILEKHSNNLGNKQISEYSKEDKEQLPQDIPWDDLINEKLKTFNSETLKEFDISDTKVKSINKGSSDFPIEHFKYLINEDKLDLDTFKDIIKSITRDKKAKEQQISEASGRQYASIRKSLKNDITKLETSLSEKIDLLLAEEKLDKYIDENDAKALSPAHLVKLDYQKIKGFSENFYHALSVKQNEEVFKLIDKKGELQTYDQDSIKKMVNDKAKISELDDKLLKKLSDDTFKGIIKNLSKTKIKFWADKIIGLSDTSAEYINEISKDSFSEFADVWIQRSGNSIENLDDIKIGHLQGLKEELSEILHSDSTKMRELFLKKAEGLNQYAYKALSANQIGGGIKSSFEAESGMLMRTLNLNKENFASLLPESLAELTERMFKKINAECFDSLTEGQAMAIKLIQFQTLDSYRVNKLEEKHFKVLKSNSLAGNAISELNTGIVSLLIRKFFALFSDEQIKAIPSENIAEVNELDSKLSKNQFIQLSDNLLKGGNIRLLSKDKFKQCFTDFPDKFSDKQLEGVSKLQTGEIDDTNKDKMTKPRFKLLSSDGISGLKEVIFIYLIKTYGFGELDEDKQIKGITEDQAKQIDSTVYNKIDKPRFNKFSKEAISGLNKATFKHLINTHNINTLNEEQSKGITTEQESEIGLTQFKLISAENIKGLDSDVFKTLIERHNIDKLSMEALKNITIEQTQKISEAQFRKLSYVEVAELHEDSFKILFPKYIKKSPGLEYKKDEDKKGQDTGTDKLTKHYYNISKADPYESRIKALIEITAFASKMNSRLTNSLLKVRAKYKEGVDDYELSLIYQIHKSMAGYVISVHDHKVGDLSLEKGKMIKEAKGIDTEDTTYFDSYKKGNGTSHAKALKYGNIHKTKRADKDKNLGTLINFNNKTDTANPDNNDNPDKENRFDAITKIAGEGARWKAVRNQAAKGELSNSTKFFTKEGENPGMFRFVDFIGLWKSWKKSFKMEYNIPNSEVIKKLEENDIKDYDKNIVDKNNTKDSSTPRKKKDFDLDKDQPYDGNF